MLQAFIPIYDQLAEHIPLLNVACFLYTLLYSFCFMQELAESSLPCFLLLFLVLLVLQNSA